MCELISISISRPAFSPLLVSLQSILLFTKKEICFFSANSDYQDTRRGSTEHESLNNECKFGTYLMRQKTSRSFAGFDRNHSIVNDQSLDFTRDKFFNSISSLSNLIQLLAILYGELVEPSLFRTTPPSRHPPWCDFGCLYRKAQSNTSVSN